MTSFQRRRRGRAAALTTAQADSAAAASRAFAGRGPLAQRKVEIGAADDAFEREADHVARKVSAGEKIDPGEITPLRPGALARAVRAQEKPDATRALQRATPVAASERKEAIQKAASSAPEKKTEAPAKPATALQRQSAPPDDDATRPAAPVQADGQAATSASGAPGAGMHSAAEQAIAGRGAGTPLSPAVRGPIESSLGADLAHVRVHDDSAARGAADALNARAFTHAYDIWLGPGASADDLGLMAHEATHVVQQAGGVHRLMRDSKKSGGDAPASADDVGTVNETNKVIVFKKLRVPKFKAKGHRAALYQGRPIRRARGYQRKSPDQTSVWDKSVDTAALRKKIAAIAGVKDGATGEYAIRHQTSGYHLIGTLEQMAEAAKRPHWGPKGLPRPMDVDHVVELQVSGWHLDTGWPNSAGANGNMELMDSAANQDSGRRIAADITRKINATRVKWPGATTGKGAKKAPSEATIRKSYELQFDAIDGAIDNAGDAENFWTWPQIAQTHAQLASFTAAKAAKGGAAAWTLFPTARGGLPKQVEAGKRKPTPAEGAWFHPFVIKEIDLQNPGSASGKSIGKISVELSPEVTKKLDGTKVGALPPLTVTRLDALPNAGAVLDDAGVLGLWRKIHAKGLSPIELRGWDVDPKKGFLAYGAIVTDVPLLGGVAIDFRVEGERVEFFKLFDAGELALPGPVQITGSSLEVFAGTAGVGVRGDAFFSIEKVGAGRVGAGARADLRGKPDFEIDGEFSFDSELFDRNRIEAWYRKREFGAKGLLAIDTPGKVKGIRKAQVDAKYEAGRLDAKGKAELSVPGVREVDLVLAYSEAEGLSIAGRLELKDDIPGIRGGSGQALVRQQPDGSWQVAASGKAQPKIPGVSAEIGFAYADGALTIEGRAAYEKGMLKGTLEVGASNRPLGPDGTPAGQPGSKFTVWGGGQLTLRLAPWLQAGVGVRLLPNGEVEVQGNIGLPAAIDLFPEKKLTKNLFSIGIDIPIVGVAVAGQRIGIFANISGGLNLDAGFGPGQLTRLGLNVTYNPAHEEQTTISGGAALKVPAHAGLRLFVQGSLGVGIPIVSARAGLEVGGALGIEGALEAAVQVDWSPAKGLKLSAVGEIYAEPKLRFDIAGFVKVEADLWITTINLYDKRWQLAAFEYGSGLRLGVRFPITYEEGKAFDLSFDQMQFEIPKIEPKALLSDLIARIA